LTALEFEPLVAPLLAIRAIAAAPLVLDEVSALAFTSRNGVAVFATLSPERDLPVFTVGDATAEAARAQGFRTVRSAGGDLADLATMLIAEAPRHGWLLVPGAREPAGDLSALASPAIRVRALPVYEALDTGMAPPEAFDAVLVHSARAARALRSRGPFAGQAAVVLSAAVAEALGGGSGLEIHVAATPDESALLEALGKPAHRV